MTLIVAVEAQGLNVTCVFDFQGNTPMLLRMAYALSKSVHSWCGESEKTRRST